MAYVHLEDDRLGRGGVVGEAELVGPRLERAEAELVLHLPPCAVHVVVAGTSHLHRTGGKSRGVQWGGPAEAVVKPSGDEMFIRFAET